MVNRNRYVPPDIQQLWEPERRFAEWFDVGISLVEVSETAGLVPAGTFAQLQSLREHIDPDRCDQLEQAHHHEVVAYLCHIQELADTHLPPSGRGVARFLHLGLTSSDLVDTANASRICKSIVVLLQRVRSCQELLVGLVAEHKNTIHLARTHGQPAHPVTFGFVLAGHLAELDRVEHRLVDILAGACGKLSGVVGVNLFVSNYLEDRALTNVGLCRTDIATQVVPRDLYTDVAYACVQTATMAERFALNIRLLQSYGEVEEVQAASDYRGSSAMPHKSNPISSERMCGLARVVRSMLPVFLENQVLWQSRDLAHSSAERLLLPDLFGLTASILATLEKVLGRIQVHRVDMSYNAHQASFSESLLHWLQNENEYDYYTAHTTVKMCIEAANKDNCNLYDIITRDYGNTAAMWCTNMTRYKTASKDAVNKFLTDRRVIEVPLSFHHKALRSVSL